MIKINKKIIAYVYIGTSTVFSPETVALTSTVFVTVAAVDGTS
jgi:hypothetical protein